MAESKGRNDDALLQILRTLAVGAFLVCFLWGDWVGGRAFFLGRFSFLFFGWIAWSVGGWGGGRVILVFFWVGGSHGGWVGGFGGGGGGACGGWIDGIKDKSTPCMHIPD